MNLVLDTFKRFISGCVDDTKHTIMIFENVVVINMASNKNNRVMRITLKCLYIWLDDKKNDFMIK